LSIDTTEKSDDDMEIIAKVNFSALPSTYAGSTKQPLNHVATPMAKGGNAKKSTSTESTAKQIGDLDDQTSAPVKTPSSIGKKSPVCQRFPLQHSYGKEDDSDTDDDDEDNDLHAANVPQAMNSLSQKQGTRILDDDDDNDDFEGMFF
jgi:hypothetical protein